MKVFLTSAYDVPTPDYGPLWLKRHARVGLDALVDRPEAADAILFVERFQGDDPFYRRVIGSELFRRMPEKCLLYHSSDGSVPFCRTLTPSNDRRYWGGKSRRTFHYIARYCENETVNAARPEAWNPRYLFSFQGAGATHAVRRQLLSLKHPNAKLVDHGQLSHHAVDESHRAEYERSYVELIQSSQFVLCPRGLGVCSYRLFEVMQLGRVPVILSDDWVPIPGIPWQSCSLTVKESDVEHLPDLLHERRSDAQEMGGMARQVWEQYFAPEVSLQRLIEAAGVLMAQPYGFEQRVLESRNMLFQPFLNMFLARLRRRLLRSVAGRFQGDAH